MLTDTLYEKLKDFQLGDLVMMSEIQDIFSEILQSDEITDKDKKLLKLLFDEFKSLKKKGSSDEKEDILSGIRKGVKRFITPAEDDVSKGIAAEEEKENQHIDLDVLQSFISEAHDHLEDIEEKIIDLETDYSPDLVDGIFRSMHTIKGVSSFLGLSRVKTTSHLLESLLDRIRLGEISVSGDLIDVLLNGCDILTKLVDDLDDKTHRKLIKNEDVKIEEARIDINPFTEALELVLTGDKEDAFEPENEQGQVVTPEMAEKFSAESMDLIDEAEQKILDLEHNDNQTELIGDAFRCIHTIKGNAGFFWYGKVECICMNLESMLDTQKKSKSIQQKEINTLLSTIDILRKAVNEIERGEAKPEPFRGDFTDILAEYDKELHIGDILVAMGEINEEDVEDALKMQNLKLGEILVKKGAVDQAAVDAALERQGRASAQVDSLQKKTKRKDIRINTDRLDHLFNLMGELITAEAMVIHNPEIINLDLPNFSKSATYLSKITREMQEVTMSMRMVPLEGLFSKMRRLVRDLSRKFKKEVQIKISGEETEMDRNVIEEISDPLVHIIRNSIDHGLEDKVQRKKNKKQNVGVIELSAKYEGNEIWITIKDDGGGLNKEKILKKAVSRGIISEEQQLSDKDIFQLIFVPGFSTADKVSEVSGRGVGMDVVRKNIDKLHGKIEVDSVEGEYTEIILKIPLTLAIVDAVTTRVGTMLYSIPIGDITSFQKPTAKEITTTDGTRSVYNHRDSLIPVIDMADFFRIEKSAQKLEEGILIIVKSANKQIALCADEIIGYRQVVIKPLPGYLGHMRAISGCSIQENGDVSMILDVNALCSETMR